MTEPSRRRPSKGKGRLRMHTFSKYFYYYMNCVESAFRKFVHFLDSDNVARKARNCVVFPSRSLVQHKSGRGLCVSYLDRMQPKTIVEFRHRGGKAQGLGFGYGQQHAVQLWPQSVRQKG